MSQPKFIATRTRGFTLIERLTVVAIIGLLVGMVVPTIRGVLETQLKMKVQTRVTNLENGCGIYKMSGTGNRYYPGQDPRQLTWLTSSTYKNAGSAMLARCLFWIPDGNDPYNLNKGDFPVSKYGQYTPDMLGEIEDQKNTIIDFSAEKMAILYYPSRLGMKGNKEQYKPEDNSKYTNSTNVALTGNTSENIQSFVQMSDNNRVSNDGTFVITASGPKRLYFDTDSVTNFD